MTLKKNLFLALIAGSAIALTASNSFAWGGHHGSCGSSGGSWGSHGSHGSYGGSWGSCGSSGGSWGSHGSHGSYGGGYAYYGGGYDGGYYDGGYASTRVIYDGVASSRPSRTVVAAKPAVKTSLTLHVPADAKITLAGIDTKQSGEVRQFATSRLAAGQSWDGYKVAVELNKNGQTLHEERTIKLVGGEDQELSINFDSTHVAKN